MLENLPPAMAPFVGPGVALGLGLLIGIERGWSHRLEPRGSRVAGVRTFALLGLLGGLSGSMATLVSPLLGASLLIPATIALLIGYARGSAGGDVSATTAIVGLITLGLGVIAAFGHTVMASVLAAVTVLVLSERRQLHAWLDRLSEIEVQAIARFGLIALAILPLLPDRDLGPLDAWNPRQIWLVVVLVSGLSLAGYALSKLFGAAKGILATSAAGAIVSSTALTAAWASRLRKPGADEPGLIAGIALASAIMFARVLILVAMLAPFALGPIAWVAVPSGLASLACVVWVLRRPRSPPEAAPEPAPVRNPFDIGPALLLAGVVMITSLLGRWSMAAVGDAGLITVLGITGMFDVDAAIITMSRLPSTSLSPLTTGLLLATPILTNTLVKAMIALWIARGKAGWRAATPLLVSLVAGLAGLCMLLVVFKR